MDFLNGGLETLRAGYNACLRTAGAAWDAATSKTAQRTVVMGLLLAFVSIMLFVFAAVGYLAFYHAYLPDQVTTVPVHLQYG